MCNKIGLFLFYFFWGFGLSLSTPIFGVYYPIKLSMNRPFLGIGLFIVRSVKTARTVSMIDLWRPAAVFYAKNFCDGLGFAIISIFRNIGTFSEIVLEDFFFLGLPWICLLTYRHMLAPLIFMVIVPCAIAAYKISKFIWKYLCIIGRFLRDYVLIPAGELACTISHWLLEKIIKPVCKFLGLIINFIFEKILVPVGSCLSATGSLIVNYIIAPVVNFVGKVLVFIGTNIIMPVINFMGVIITFILDATVYPIIRCFGGDAGRRRG